MFGVKPPDHDPIKVTISAPALAAVNASQKAAVCGKRTSTPQPDLGWDRRILQDRKYFRPKLLLAAVQWWCSGWPSSADGCSSLCVESETPSRTDPDSHSRSLESSVGIRRVVCCDSYRFRLPRATARLRTIKEAELKGSEVGEHTYSNESESLRHVKGTSLSSSHLTRCCFAR